MARMFRFLTADEIEVKVKQVKRAGAHQERQRGIKPAGDTDNQPVDMDLLDETVGAGNWTNDYKEIKGNLYAGIGIIQENGGIQWKWDCGIESREDEEGNQKKGEASDAFKRAGFRWGIGRELYTSPFVWIPGNKAEIKASSFNGKTRFNCYDKFSVEKIAYDEKTGRITGLAIRNDTKNLRAFVWQQS